jgi:regulatory protein
VHAAPEASATTGSRGGKRLDIHERALGLLAVRQRSRRELERRLVQAGFEPDAVQGEIERLERVGLIDDEAFARAVVESRMGRRGESRRAVAARLSSAGVDRELATTVLDSLGGDETASAERLATERARRLIGVEPQIAFQRLSGFLARKGYAPHVARQAARRALDVAAADD